MGFYSVFEIHKLEYFWISIEAAIEADISQSSSRSFQIELLWRQPQNYKGRRLSALLSSGSLPSFLRTLRLSSSLSPIQAVVAPTGSAISSIGLALLWPTGRSPTPLRWHKASVRPRGLGCSCALAYLPSSLPRLHPRWTQSDASKGDLSNTTRDRRKSLHPLPDRPFSDRFSIDLPPCITRKVGLSGALPRAPLSWASEQGRAQCGPALSKHGKKTHGYPHRIPARRVS